VARAFADIGIRVKAKPTRLTGEISRCITDVMAA
jgi:hypothetical protein